MRYCYSSLSCGLCLLQQLLRSKNQHRSHGKSDRRIRDAINSPSFCNFNLTLPYEKFAPQNPREPRILNPGRMSRFDRNRLFINILCINVYITEEDINFVFKWRKIQSNLIRSVDTITVSQSLTRYFVFNVLLSGNGRN